MKHALAVILAFCLASCDTGSDTPPAAGGISTPAVDTVPFITCNYIELDKIDRISKFRSAYGHDYSDAFEHCRSMKHYFQPKDSVDWASIRIFAPVSGRITRIDEEWAGTQIHIEPFNRPLTWVIIFHVAMRRPFIVGDTVTAGQQIGTHIGSQTMSDIAVGRSAAGSWQLISYFTAVTDSVFQLYAARGMRERRDCIISREERDANPLGCSGETFTTGGGLQDWIILR